MTNFARLFSAVLAVLATLLAGGSSPAGGQNASDPQGQEYKPYEVVNGISGNVSSVGSDTLNSLMSLWSEKFKRYYPGVSFQIEGKGSNTAPAALTQGLSQLAPMSRPMKAAEVDAFEARFGYRPTEIQVAIDALAVFVNKDNPIKSLTLEEVDAIFSKTRRRGGKELRTWGQLGLTGEWADRPISLYGRNGVSGTNLFFKEQLLKGGDFKDEVKEQAGSASVAQGVSDDRFGIGYSGVGYVSSSIHAVPLAEKRGQTAFAATREHAYSGDYPLTRPLYVYVNRAPAKPCEPVVREFIRMICSKEGQELVEKDGFFPIPSALAKEGPKNLD